MSQFLMGSPPLMSMDVASPEEGQGGTDTPEQINAGAVPGV